MSVAAEASGLEELGDAFVQPGRAAAAGELGDERVSQFMLQNVRQFRRHGTQAADRDAQLAVIDRSGPGGGVRDIEEGLLGVEGDQNVVAGRIAEIANQVVVVGFERRQDLCAKSLGGLLALVVQNEMTAFALSEVGFDSLLALSFGQELLRPSASGRNSRERFQEATASLVWSEAN